MKDFKIKREDFLFKKSGNIKQEYDFLKELGKGGYGVVYLA